MSATGGTGVDARADAARALLRDAAARYVDAALASSFGAEDMVLIDIIGRHALPVAVFTLDTGRLPEETHALIDRVRTRYGIHIEVYAPDAAALESFVRTNGSNAFYRSIALRQQCCAVRKVAPLSRALAGRGAWITGLRRSQSVTRADVEIESFDAAHGIAKVNPLADWSDDDVWDHLHAFDVPVNALHAQGYPSIGCAPCTRAVLPGEDLRAGRWWWERPEHRECGLHRRPAQPIEPAVKVTA